MIDFSRSVSSSSVSFRQVFALACVFFCTSVFTAAHGNEPSALEIKQIQTRVFKVEQKKLEDALLEFCQNLGGFQNPNTYGRLPWIAECVGPAQRYKGLTFKWKWELDKHPEGMLLRLRVFAIDKQSSRSLTFDSRYYDALFRGLADALVLNEIGVDVRVFQ